MYILRGNGCHWCRRERTSKSKTLTTSQFIERAIGVHGDKYSYNNTKYKRTSNPVVITCKYHGDFEQIAANHLQGNGCPRCNHWDVLAKHRPNEQATLYHVQFEDTKTGVVFNKIGITIKKWNYRFHGIGPLGFRVRLIESFEGTCHKCNEKEIKILKYLEESGKRYRCRELQGNRIGGWTETYYPDGITEETISIIINS